MKKQMKILAFLPLFLLGGCSSSQKYLEKPEDTNLSFWITEKVELSSFEECTFIPGGFGVDIYLDKRYEPIIQEDNQISVPLTHVTYHVTKYPDYSDKDSCVTHIEITDPSIYLYGLSMKSSEEEISSKMKELGFEENDKTYTKNNCSFYFSSEEIRINAYVTNKNNLQF